MKLTGKRALVTGGGRGIGHGIALCLGKYGADLVLGYRKDESAIQETIAELKRMGRKARAVKADITNPQEVEAMVAEAVKGSSPSSPYSTEAALLLAVRLFRSGPKLLTSGGERWNLPSSPPTCLTEW